MATLAFQRPPRFPLEKAPQIEFQLDPQKFTFLGMDLSHPPDLMPDGKMPLARNVRSYQDGTVQTRPGLSLIKDITGAGGTVHSIKRLNDDVPGASTTYKRIVGANTSVYSGQTGAYTLLESGFSGNPLSFCSHRPTDSPEPWMYMADANKMRKTNVAGQIFHMGIAPPTAAPVAALATPLFKVIDTMDSTAGWAGGGAAFDGGTGFTNADRVNTTILAGPPVGIKYDSGTTGPCLITPTAFNSFILPGMLVTINSGGGTAETVVVEDTFNPVFTTTIASIIYDSGTSGPCSIQLTTPDDSIQLNMMLLIAGAEYVRVTAVTEAPTGIHAFRCSTASTRSAGDSVAGVASFRVNTANTHTGGETLTCKYLEFKTTASGVTYITKTGAIDLSHTGGRPIQPNDLIHLSFKISDQSLLTEGQVQFDINRASNNYDENYLYKPFRANDLTPSVLQTTSTLAIQQRIIQRQQIGLTFGRQKLLGLDTNPEVLFQPDESSINDQFPMPAFPGVVPNDQTDPGKVFSELVFPVSDLIRVGTDESRTLLDVLSIRLSFNVTGAVTIDVDDWWIGGTYGPTADPLGNPINYCYIGRASATGVRSNPSPPMRNGVSPKRQRVTVTLTTYDTTASGDAQVDKLDVYRIGSTLLDWTYVGTADNPANAASTTATFNDDYPDEALLSNEVLQTDNWQPFPSLDIPRSGTCTVSGTTVTRTAGDNFNLAWPRGTIITIAGVGYLTYSSPSSTTRLELEQSAGSQVGVTWTIPAAIIQGQPLAAMWGPYGGGEFGAFMFACGDNNRSGTLYWTKGNEPDSAPDINFLEVASPTEPLMNGCVYSGRAYVFSSERLYLIRPNFTYASRYTTVGDSQFNTELVSDSIGLYARWGLTVGEYIYFIGKDGIYKTDGSQHTSITDADLYPLFPHDGQPGVMTGEVAPPDFTLPNNLQLEAYDGYVYFDYIDTSGGKATLVYNEKTGAWVQDTYSQGGTSHYGEEGRGIHNLLVGCADGKLYQTSGLTDAGVDISWQLRTPSFDNEDTRSRKIWTEYVLDFENSTTSTDISLGLDNYSSLVETSTLTASSRDQVLIGINGGLGRLARNIGLDLSGDSPAKLYGYNFSWLNRPEDSKTRATDWHDEDVFGAKFVQGCIIEADTFGTDKGLQVQYDGGVVGATLTINHNGQIEKAYAFPSPFVGHSMRLVPADDVLWRLHRIRWVYEPEPESATHWISQPTTHDLHGYQHIREIWVALRSVANVTLTVTIDNVAYTYATIPSTGDLQSKVYIPGLPLKGKTFQYSLVSALPFALYQLNSETHVKSWGSPQPYQTMAPWGDLSHESGARI